MRKGSKMVVGTKVQMGHTNITTTVKPLLALRLSREFETLRPPLFAFTPTVSSRAVALHAQKTFPSIFVIYFSRKIIMSHAKQASCAFIRLKLKLGLFMQQTSYRIPKPSCPYIPAV
jgi:hypothetical protein